MSAETYDDILVKNELDVSVFDPQNMGDKNLTLHDYMVTFSGQSQLCAVGLIDMVNSTIISAHLTPEKLARYYEMFLNSMSKIIGRYHGQVIKNIGDCLIYYFPESNINKKSGFIDCLASSVAMIEFHETLCDRLHVEGLPPIDYRISMDYGSVLHMRTNHSLSLDLIGPPINLCSKINCLASPNEIVIGGDLYSQVKVQNQYEFREIKGISIGLKHTYPVYKILCK